MGLRFFFWFRKLDAIVPMRSSSFSFLAWMGLGALMCTIGFQWTFSQAKQDRASLLGQVAKLEEERDHWQLEHEQLADRVNQRVEAAAEQIKAAQARVDSLEKEQLLLAQALPLTRPTGRSYTSWVEAFSLPLGISLRLPPGTKTYADERGFIAMRSNATSSSLPWLSVSPYTEGQENYLAGTLRDTTPVSYLIAGNLVTGVRGRREGQTSGYTYVLRVTSPSSEQASHLIWAQTEKEITENRLQDTLATLALRS